MFCSIITVNSLEETIDLGKKLGKLVKSGDLLVLNGDLGVGKTHFAKGIAQGLDVKEYINSPSYTIINEYMGRIPFYHFDVYRLSEKEEMYDLGYEEYFYGKGVTLIEWGEKVIELLPSEYIEIRLRKVSDNYEDEYKREIIFNPHGNRYLSLIKELAY